MSRFQTGRRIDTGFSGLFFLTKLEAIFISPSIDGNTLWNFPMATPLEKARKAPDSMKAKILKSARRIFGEYGFHGTTTRMIAKEVGIDISTLYYHWGEKQDLFEAVIIDINDDLRSQLVAVENVIRGLPLEKRMDISIDRMTDFLFKNPEISNLVLFQYFGKTRSQTIIDFEIPEFISGIATSMGLCKNRKHVPSQIQLQVLAVMNSIHNFISGERFFRNTVKLNKNGYKKEVKKTFAKMEFY